MQITVLIEPVPGNGFRAKAGRMFPFTAEGPTREDVLRQFREKIQVQLAAGAELVPLDVPADNPWPAMFGVFRDEPEFAEWQEGIAEYRRQVDEDLDAR